MSRVLVNHLRVRDGPSTNSPEVASYDSGQIINSGNLIIFNEGRYWLRYTSASGNQRYICAYDTNGAQFIDVPQNIPGPRPGGNPASQGETVIPGIPRQKQFPDNRIKKEGCCFLCTCVKGGLTTYDQCMDCFNWGMSSGKLRARDCFVSYDKETWAREISQRYGTPYHGDYIFQKSGRPHFWLTQGGREIFNSMGIGYH